MFETKTSDQSKDADVLFSMPVMLRLNHAPSSPSAEYYLPGYNAQVRRKSTDVSEEHKTSLFREYFKSYMSVRR
jgi:hypothetical protein